MLGLNRADIIGRLGAVVIINRLATGGRVANVSSGSDSTTSLPDVRHPGFGLRYALRRHGSHPPTARMRMKLDSAIRFTMFGLTESDEICSALRIPSS